MRFKRYRRGNLTFLSNFRLPFYESDFVRRVGRVSVKNKRLLVEADENGKWFMLYICEWFVRLSRKSEDIQVVWDYDESDRLERLVAFIPISDDDDLKYIEIIEAKEYEPIEYTTYVFKRDGYYYFFMDIDEVMSIINLEELEELMELQRKWDEMVRNS